jgi:hypothetical protein
VSEPTGPRSEMGPVLRGVLLTALAVAVGVGVLSSISRIHSTPSAAVSTPPTTTRSAPTSTTTTTLATHPPSSVKVLVANGTSTKGVAGTLAAKLHTDGYDTLAPTNTTSTANASAVYYTTGYQGDADAVASAAGLTSSAVQSLTSSVTVPSSSAEVVVVVGPDLASRL